MAEKKNTFLRVTIGTIVPNGGKEKHSKVQITLHTGCYFLPGNSKPVLFAGVSDSLQRDPAAVWAFLRPVPVDLKEASL